MSGEESTFNPKNPNNFAVDAQLLLVPGFLILIFAVYLIYKLLNNYKQKEADKLEKKKKRDERKKK